MGKVFFNWPYGTAKSMREAGGMPRLTLRAPNLDLTQGKNLLSLPDTNT